MVTFSTRSALAAFAILCTVAFIHHAHAVTDVNVQNHLFSQTVTKDLARGTNHTWRLTGASKQAIQTTVREWGRSPSGGTVQCLTYGWHAGSQPTSASAARYTGTVSSTSIATRKLEAQSCDWYLTVEAVTDASAPSGETCTARLTAQLQKGDTTGSSSNFCGTVSSGFSVGPEHTVMFVCLAVAMIASSYFV